MHKKLKYITRAACPCGKEDQITGHMLKTVKKAGEICNLANSVHPCDWPDSITANEKKKQELMINTAVEH